MLQVNNISFEIYNKRKCFKRKCFEYFARANHAASYKTNCVFQKEEEKY